MSKKDQEIIPDLFIAESKWRPLRTDVYKVGDK